ncbi:MAG: glucose-1-phosphate thymidylyltransferase [Anaerolineales bacterium]|nr:glucose-1-phosphate thymidylyltransferase [Anaerolineales bacterium]
MKGLILSGGKGTRLRPLTHTRAKQLIPVANEPVLFRVIRAIRDAGITEIGIVVGDTEPEIREAVGDGSRWGVAITYIRQSAPAGLAHAVKESLPFIGDDRFVMFLGDNVIQGGISPLIRQFAESSWNSQIVLKRVPNPSSFGVAELNADGSIKRLIEKPKNPPSDLALVGIYMFDQHIREAVHAIQPSGRGELEITDAIQWLVTQGYAVHPYVHEGWWIDTGKGVDMLTANDHVLEELKPTIAGTVDAASSVDPRVTVEAGAEIINSIVRGPTIIGEGARIVNSYVGPFTSIYHHVVIENSEIEHAIVLEHTQILNVGARIQDSLIGREAIVQHTVRRPATLQMHLGDYSQVDLP